MYLYISIFTSLISSTLLSFILLPIIQRICFQKKLYDTCSERKVHIGVVPRLGGVSFLPAMVLAFFLVVSINIYLGTSLISEIHRAYVMEWMLVLSSVIFIYLTGFTDDLLEIRYRNKLLIQVITSLLFVTSGTWIHNLNGLFGLYEINAAMGIFLTVVVIVTIINSFNFIDGIDGLAAGIAMLAFLFFGLSFFYFGLYIYCIFAFSALGMLIPFFYYNIFGKVCNNNKIFMGDCGSLTIGLLLAIFAMKIYQAASIRPEHSLNALVWGFAILIVPLFDALRVVIFRLIKGRSPFKADRNHMHHQLLDLGFSHKVATLFILTNAIFFGTLTFFLVPYLNINLLVLGLALLWGIIDFILRRCVKKSVRVASFQKKKMTQMKVIQFKKLSIKKYH